MRNVLAVFLAALTGSGLATQAPQPTATGLDAGIQQVKDGHFDAALLTLDAVVRQLRSDPARHPELVRAFVYLGAAYVGLQQESPARENFKEALKLDKALQLDPNEFPPRVVRVFEAARKGKSKSAMYAGGGIGVVAIVVAAAVVGGAGSLSASQVGDTTTTTTPTTTTTTLPRGTVPGGGAAFMNEFVEDQRPGASPTGISGRSVMLSRILLNGAPVPTSGEGLASGESRSGRNVVEAVALDPHGLPGVWRFSFKQGLQVGSIRTLEGQLAEITWDSIAYRLAGRSGERVAFTFIAEP